MRRLTRRTFTLTFIACASSCRRSVDRPVVADTAGRRAPVPSVDSGVAADSAQIPYRLDQPSDTAQLRRDRFISDGPRAWFGRTRARITAAFGPPDKIEGKASATEGGGPLDSLVTFHYPRAEFAFYIRGNAHEDLLLQVTISDARFLKSSPIPLGSTVADVRSYFGDSDHGETSSLRYTRPGIGDDLELWFEHDRLVKLRWTYGFD